MPPNSSLYRFRVSVSDVDRGYYGDLDFRVAMHPSESFPYLLTRVIGYTLSYEDGLTFSGGGLSDPDEPSLSMADPRGGYSLWIEVGNPSARRVHKAAKASKRVRVFTYKNPEALLRELEGEDVHKAEAIEIYSLESDFLKALEATLERDNAWTLIRNEGSLIINVGDEPIAGELARHSVR